MMGLSAAADKLVVLNYTIFPGFAEDLEGAAEALAIATGSPKSEVVVAAWGAHHMRHECEAVPWPEDGAALSVELAKEVQLKAWSDAAHGTAGAINAVLASDVLLNPDLLTAGMYVVGGDKATAAAMELAAVGNCDVRAVTFDPSPQRQQHIRDKTKEGFARAMGTDLGAAPVQVRYGNLLDAPEDVIGHQCNLQTAYAAGVAADMFARFPEADCYKAERPREWFGSCQLRRTPGGKIVANIFGQVAGGAAGRVQGDSSPERLQAFKNGVRIALEEARSAGTPLALPFGIGCGLGGGDWDLYFAALAEAAHEIGARVVLYVLLPTCGLCQQAMSPGSTRTHVDSAELCCDVCTRSCRCCGETDGVFFDDSDAPLRAEWCLAAGEAGSGEQPDGTAEVLAFRSSFLSWGEEVLDADAGAAIPWRCDVDHDGGPCLNCASRGTQALHSAFLHIWDVRHGWTRQDKEAGDLDKQMSVSSVATTALPRAIGCRSRREGAEAWLKTALEEEKASLDALAAEEEQQQVARRTAAAKEVREAAEASLAEARAKERTHIHVIWVPQHLVGTCDVIDFSTWKSRADHLRAPIRADGDVDWSPAREWASACGLPVSRIQYGASWGDALSEVVLSRTASGGFAAVSVPLEDICPQLCASVEQASLKGAWCGACRDDLEGRVRRELLLLAKRPQELDCPGSNKEELAMEDA